MQRRFVWQALEQLPDERVRSGSRRILDARALARPQGGAVGRRTFPSPDTPSRQLNAFMTPAQRRLMFEDFFVFQTGLALRRHENAQVRKALVSKVDDRIRQCARAVLPFKLTEGQREALAEIVADMQQRLADAAAAAGRRRRRQDDRRAAGGDRGDGERLPGRLHGADRDPRRAALPHDRQGAGRQAVSRRAAERTRHRGRRGATAAGDRARRRSTSSSAPRRWSRSTSSSRRWRWP